jgi:hypothetical protein
MKELGMFPNLGKSVGAVVLGFVALALTGCGDNGGWNPFQPSAKQTVNSIVDTRKEIVKAQNDLEKTLASLDELEHATGDVRPSYERFKKSFADTQAQADRARARAQDFREHRDEYLKAWEDEVSKINNPDLQTTAKQRVAAVKERFDAIHDVAQNCREAYGPFINDLNDVQRYFASDLTPDAVRKASPVIDQARKDGGALMGKLNDLILQMNVISADLTPTGKIPEKKTM